MIPKNKSTKLNTFEIINSSIKHQSFVDRELYDSTVLFQTIQFSISQS